MCVCVCLFLYLSFTDLHLYTHTHTAPLLAADSPTRVEGQYIVVLNEDLTDDEGSVTVYLL